MTLFELRNPMLINAFFALTLNKFTYVHFIAIELWSLLIYHFGTLEYCSFCILVVLLLASS